MSNVCNCSCKKYQNESRTRGQAVSSHNTTNNNTINIVVAFKKHTWNNICCWWHALVHSPAGSTMKIDRIANTTEPENDIPPQLVSTCNKASSIRPPCPTVQTGTVRSGRRYNRVRWLRCKCCHRGTRVGGTASCQPPYHVFSSCRRPLLSCAPRGLLDDRHYTWPETEPVRGRFYLTSSRSAVRSP